jgi:hypothetical protein
MGKTDSNGYAMSYIIPNDIIYRFVVVYEDLVYFTSNLATVPCDPADYLCDYSIQVVSTGDNEYTSFINNVAVGCEYDNTTQNVYCTSTDPSGTGSFLQLSLYRKGDLSDTLICQNNLSAGSGTVICHIDDTQNYTHWYIGTSTIGSIIIIGKGTVGQVGVGLDRMVYEDAGMAALGAVVTVFVGATLGLAGGFGGMIIGAILGLALAAIMGFINIAFETLVALSAVGLILAWILTRG